MALIHVAFPEGAAIDMEQNGADFRSQLGRIAADTSIVRTETYLPVGITRVTPAHWVKHTHEYFAEALPNGDGVMHVLPRDDGVVFIDSDYPEVPQRGGRHLLLPQEENFVPILGPKLAQLALYTLIVHMPEGQAEH